jgi:predicted O-methyltransferase YrrM
MPTELPASNATGGTRTFRNLRLVGSGAFSEYLINSMLFRWLGNLRFADFILQQANLDSQYALASDPVFDKPYVLYHSWLEGNIELSQGEALALGPAMDGKSVYIDPEFKALFDLLGEKGWLDDVPINLDQLVNKCIGGFSAIQNHYEMRQFLNLVLAKRPRKILEIGTARGGMLYGLAQVAQPDAMCICIDLFGGRNGGGQTETEREVFASFGPPTQRFHFIEGNSQSAETAGRLENILAGSPLDVIFIDGDHSLAAVEIDYATYRRFIAPDGIMVFHDISMFPESWGAKAEVGLFWNELSRKCKTHAIVDPLGVRSKAKESRQNWAFGIGIVSGEEALK